jgi:predicted CopG family antitoxin
VNTRHTISITDDANKRLRNKGKFGESFTDLILRLINLAERNSDSNPEGEDL